VESLRELVRERISLAGEKVYVEVTGVAEPSVEVRRFPARS
jgi:hypothetical protein